MQKPLINGRVYSHSSITIKIPDLGEELIGVESISYKQEQEPGNAYGTLPVSLGRTTGQYKASGSLTLFRTESDNLTWKMGPQWFGRTVTIIVSFADEGCRTVTDYLEGVRLTNQDFSSSQGSDPLKVKYDLDIWAISTDGIYSTIVD